MRKHLFWPLLLIGLAGLVAGFYWVRRQPNKAPTDEILRTGAVVRGDLVISVSTSGTVSMRRVSRVVPTTTAKVARVLVSLQQRVVEGQILGTLDDVDLLRTIEQAEIAVRQAELALDVAQRSTDSEQVRLAELTVSTAAEALELARIGTETARVDAETLIVQAQRQREQAYIRYRDAPDGDEKSRAQTAFEQSETQEHIARLNADLTRASADAQYKAALLNLVQAQNALDTLRKPPDEDTIEQRALDVEQARLRLQQAKRALRDAELIAPHSGLVASIDASEGAVLRAGQQAFTIVDDSAIYVDATIDEIDIGAVEVGQEATLVPDAYPDVTLAGVVESIAPASTNVGGLVAYRVRIELLPTEEARLLDGMAVGAQIITEVLGDRTLVPSWAVRRDQETYETYCLTVREEGLQRTTVEIGRSNELYAEVTNGLTVGDTVALVAQERSFFDAAPQGGPPWANQ
ncbi:MAG: efflux RND transporter periplasmic adaptor subunit [Anaerolineae bacterium]|nr:efflux RND transporter periplasmic adaptor subunit [Anaerolineae bacterium]